MELALLGVKFALGVKLMTVLALILLVPMVIVALLVNVLQSAMQLNDSSLSLLPKLAAVGITIVMSWNLIARELVRFAAEIFALVAVV